MLLNTLRSIERRRNAIREMILGFVINDVSAATNTKPYEYLNLKTIINRGAKNTDATNLRRWNGPHKQILFWGK